MSQVAIQFYRGEAAPILNQHPINIPVRWRTAPVFSHLAATRIAPVTHQDQAVWPAFRPPPWRLCRPRETLVPHRVQIKRTDCVAARVGRQSLGGSLCRRFA